MANEIAINQQAEGNQQDEHGQPAGKKVHLMQKRRGQGLHAGQQVTDLANLGGAACGGDHRAPLAGNNQCAAKQH